MTRLHPISSLGVTRRRSSRSLIALLICSRPAARNGGSSQRCPVIAAAPSSMKPNVSGAVEPLERGEALAQPDRPLAVGEVELRDGPARRALVDVHVLDDRLDRRHDLDRAAAGPDHRHPPAGELDVVAPSRGVEGRAVEALEPRDRGNARTRELAARGDQDVGLVRARAGLQHPPAALVVPLGTLHVRAGADLVQHAMTARDVLDVVLDLGLRRVAARPARVGREGELVQVRGDVAGRAGIGVVVPHAADSLAALEHGHVVVPGPAQHHDRGDTGKAASDHRDRAPAGACAAAVPGLDGAHGIETTRYERGGRPESRCATA